MFACDDQALVITVASLINNEGLDVTNGVAGLNIKRDGLASDSLHKDLHRSRKCTEINKQTKEVTL